MFSPTETASVFRQYLGEVKRRVLARIGAAACILCLAAVMAFFPGLPRVAAIFCLAYAVHGVWRLRRELAGAPVAMDTTILGKYAGLNSSGRLKVNIRQAVRLTPEGQCIPLNHWRGERTITVPRQVYAAARCQDNLRLLCFPNGIAVDRLERYLPQAP